MIVVTGGAGFIGSNLVRGLNDRGVADILIVDNLSNGHKFKNIADCTIADYLDKNDFLDLLEADAFPNIEAIFHEGACSVTTEWDGRYMMQNNFEYSKRLLKYALSKSIPYSYASSAATYGGGQIFREDKIFEKPLNVYGYSKLLFDQYVRRILPVSESQVVGFRYFNVYGPREQHKGSMASVAYHLYNQMLETGNVRLFEGCDGYGDGEQSRDFIYVSDIVNAKLWFLDHPDKSGIFNLGTGKSEPFNHIAKAVIKHFGRGNIEYISFPDHLKGSYQSFTEADLSALRMAGFQSDFSDVATGVSRYLKWLEKQ